MVGAAGVCAMAVALHANVKTAAAKAKREFIRTSLAMAKIEHSMPAGLRREALPALAKKRRHDRDSGGDQIATQLRARQGRAVETNRRCVARLRPGEQRIGELVDVHGLALCLRLRELPQRLAHGIGIEYRDRRAAVRARRITRQIDRRTAIGALDGPNFGLELGELCAGDGPYEILFEQELNKRCEPAVAPLAPVIAEMGRMLQIVREHEPRIAARAIEQGRKRIARLGAMSVEGLENLDHCAGRELRRLQMTWQGKQKSRATAPTSTPSNSRACIAVPQAG